MMKVNPVILITRKVISWLVDDGLLKGQLHAIVL